jgi:hypothetical protein
MGPAGLGPPEALAIPNSHHADDGLVLWTGLGQKLVERIWPGSSNVLDVLAPAMPRGGARSGNESATE